jgi:hypothetical protein
MTVRFDDSLPILVRVVREELGEEAFTSGVALRDATGRLAFFASNDLDEATSERIAIRLRRELGPYARADRVLAGLSDFGVQEMLKDPSALRINVGDSRVRLVDRRLVGIDWLRAPAPFAPPPARFAFISLKGGVGRSTALCVAAADLASRARRVLAVDLDMEAPGLGAMLLDQGTLPEFGLIDALVENSLSPLDDRFYSDLVGPSALAERHGRIDVIPAFGRRSMQNPGDVLGKIARAYTENVGPDGGTATLLDQVRSLVDHFADPARYDAILIDARAGLHETTASAILGLGAEVFLFGLDEPQTFQGYAVLLAHMARFVEPENPLPEWLDRVTMVHGKASTDAEERAVFVEKCSTLFANARLGPPRSHVRASIQFPAAPFSDVPWDDDARDEDVLADVSSPRDPLAILDDIRYRQFEPMRRRDLLSQEIYRSSFGMFVDRVNETFTIDGKDRG